MSRLVPADFNSPGWDLISRYYKEGFGPLRGTFSPHPERFQAIAHICLYFLATLSSQKITLNFLSSTDTDSPYTNLFPTTSKKSCIQQHWSPQNYVTMFGPLQTPQGFVSVRKLIFASSPHADQVSNTPCTPQRRKCFKCWQHMPINFHNTSI